MSILSEYEEMEQKFFQRLHTKLDKTLKANGIHDELSRIYLCKDLIETMGSHIDITSANLTFKTGRLKHNKDTMLCHHDSALEAILAMDKADDW